MSISKNSLERLANSFLTTDKVADRAKELNLWVYDPPLKEWFSPDEFRHVYRELPQGHPILTRVEYKNPFGGIVAGHQKMKTLQEKISTFTERVIYYYTSKK